MPIIKGSTPTIRIVLSADEVEPETITKVFLTFAQKNTVITALNTEFVPSGSDPLDYDPITRTITFKRKLTQSETLALTEDVDLDCQLDVLTSDDSRKVSKLFSFGICKVLRDSVLTATEE